MLLYRIFFSITRTIWLLLWTILQVFGTFCVRTRHLCRAASGKSAAILARRRVPGRLRAPVLNQKGRQRRPFRIMGKTFGETGRGPCRHRPPREKMTCQMSVFSPVQARGRTETVSTPRTPKRTRSLSVASRRYTRLGPASTVTLPFTASTSFSAPKISVMTT